MKKFLIGLVIVLVIIIIGLVIYSQQPKAVQPVACTEEAKLCPDGATSVGRQGPNCEFAPCPVAVAKEMSKSDWQNRLTEIKSLIKAEFPTERAEEDGNRLISVGKVFNFDGTNGAIINLGFGGASTEAMAIVMMVNDHPRVISLNVGGSLEKSFLSGGSVTHGSNIDVLSEKSLVYIANWEVATPGSKGGCQLFAYVWDKNNQTFVFDKTNDNTLEIEYCKNKPPRGDV